MNKDEIKKIFLELLADDEEFRHKLTEFILEAVAEKFAERVTQAEEPIEVAETEPDEKISAVENELNRLQSELETVRNEKNSVERQLETVRNEKNSVERQLETVRNEKNSVERQLETVHNEKNSVERQLETIRNEKNSVERQLESVRNEKNSVERQLESVRNEKNSVERQLETVRNEKNSVERQLETVRNEKNSVERQLTDVSRAKISVERQLETVSNEKFSAENERDELKNQLAERFPDGWEIYQKFLSIDADTRKESGLYTQNFVSFICSGAQLKRLETVWDAALDSKRNGKIDNAKIFWEVFKYCVRLVNAAQGDKAIELLNTQIGDRYDTNSHSTSGTNSAAQGVVREIILVGYCNNIGRKIVKKSNVRVG